MAKLFVTTQQRFSIRKYAIGVASVLLGTAILTAPVVSADEVVATTTPAVELTTPSVVENVAVAPVVETTISEAVEPAPESVPTPASSPVTEEAPVEIVTPTVPEVDNAKPAVIESVSKTEEPTPETPVSNDTPSLKVDGPTETPTGEPSKQDVKVAEPVAENSPVVPLDREEKKEGSVTEKTVDVENAENLVKSPVDNGVSISISRTGFRNASRSTLIGDDYPWKYQPQNSVVDPWGMYSRQCTSFVAHRLSTANKFELPSGYGHAGQWGYTAQNQGYRVDMTPAKGTVAWFGPSAFGGDPRYGHVAWVANVYGDKVELEEYNMNWSANYSTRIINKSEVSGYIHFKDLVAKPVSAPVTSVPITTTQTAPDLPSSGRYTFTERTGVKNEPKLSSPDLAYYDAGGSVTYDSKLEAEGHQWISYISYSGVRRYVAVGKLATSTPESPKPVAPSQPVVTTPSQPATQPVAAITLPPSGQYTFTKRTGVKNEPKISSADIAFYDVGGVVNYDRVVKSDGHQWVSYISYSGVRRYVLAE